MITVSPLNVGLLLLLGVAAAIPYPRRKKEARPPKVQGNRFAFVSSAAGEPIHKGPGGDVIGRLPKGTYVGVLTDNTSGDYQEIAVGINSGGQDLAYYFWIDSKGFDIVIGRENANKLLASGAKEKTNNILDKIVDANA